jgi:hypothetical protein
MSEVLTCPEHLKLYLVPEHIGGLDCVRQCLPALENPVRTVRPRWVKADVPDIYYDELFILDSFFMMLNRDNNAAIYDYKRDKLIQQLLIPGDPYPFTGWIDVEETGANTLTRYKIIYRSAGRSTRTKAFHYVTIRDIHPIQLLQSVQSLFPARLIKGKILSGIEDMDGRVTHLAIKPYIGQQG